MEQLKALYAATFGAPPAQVVPLEAAGSNRRYYRLAAPSAAAGRPTVVGVVGTSAEENATFCALARALAERGVAVPEVYAASADAMRYLQQDLGSVSLFDFIAQGRADGGRYTGRERAMLRRVMSDLPHIQLRCADSRVYDLCRPLRSMDADSVGFDLNYFKYCYLKLSGAEFDELRLERDFRALTADLLRVEEQGFMYRDFQARNVMLVGGVPHYIDFQGGRRGPVYYDVASFLWQASARYPDELKDELADAYLASLHAYIPVAKPAFMARLRRFALFRTLQVLGAYGFRGLWERKPHFVSSIAPAVANLAQLARTDAGEPYPYLRRLAGELAARTPQGAQAPPAPPQPSPRAAATAAPRRVPADSPLRVRVYSFSYKKGIPPDESGNGGGYVFDCRGVHNPGRYERYQSLTGLDRPVVEFLEGDGEILRFMQSVYSLAEAHVLRYAERGFSHLMFAFGCTGGQHRSVYAAQHLAERLHDTLGVRVSLCHREQDIRQELR